MLLQYEETANITDNAYLNHLLGNICSQESCSIEDIRIGGVMSSEQIGDGSSREQAASSQKVLGGFANIANEYATKRYRSNLINWGVLPFHTEEQIQLEVGDYVLVRNVKEVVANSQETVELEVYHEIPGDDHLADGNHTFAPDYTIKCTLDSLTEDEKKILLAGSLINYYQQ